MPDGNFLYLHSQLEARPATGWRECHLQPLDIRPGGTLQPWCVCLHSVVSRHAFWRLKPAVSSDTMEDEIRIRRTGRRRLVAAVGAPTLFAPDHVQATLSFNQVPTI